MKQEILYLSFFPPEAGLLFPDELPTDYYAPGLFIAQQVNDDSLAYAYSFDAMDAGRRVSLKLVRQYEADPQSSLYVVRTDHYGSFWFSLVPLNPEYVYRGRKQTMRNHNPLQIAVARDSTKLERVCKEFDFYFIGSTLNVDGEL